MNTASVGYTPASWSRFAVRLVQIHLLHFSHVSYKSSNGCSLHESHLFLGIPCRSVTNYVSAHDTNRTFTVDKYFDRDGNEVPNGPDEDCYDSCWNFHVWNDVWMQRPDLPQGMKYMNFTKICSSTDCNAFAYFFYFFLKAIAAGRSLILHLKRKLRLYTTVDPLALRLFAEARLASNMIRPSCIVSSTLNFATSKKRRILNGASLGWLRTSISKYIKLLLVCICIDVCTVFVTERIIYYRVGRKILTKNPNRDDDEGDSDMLEITHEYKTVDSSSPERLAVIASCRGYQRLQQYYEYPDRNFEDVYFDLMDIDLVPYGQPFDCTMNIQVPGYKLHLVNGYAFCIIKCHS